MLRATRKTTRRTQKEKANGKGKWKKKKKHTEAYDINNKIIENWEVRAKSCLLSLDRVFGTMAMQLQTIPFNFYFYYRFSSFVALYCRQFSYFFFRRWTKLSSQDDSEYTRDWAQFSSANTENVNMLHTFKIFGFFVLTHLNTST